MFSRWVTSSYSPPDDVMSFNCNDLASRAEAEKKNEEKERDGRGEEWAAFTKTFFASSFLYF